MLFCKSPQNLKLYPDHSEYANELYIEMKSMFKGTVFPGNSSMTYLIRKKYYIPFYIYLKGY